MDTAISVPFHGNTLFVVEHDGQPYTPMKPIVEGMGMDWASQFVKVKQRFASSIVEIAMVAEDGKQREMTCLAMRKLAGWLMTIYPNKVKPEIRESIIRYQNECDDALWDYWTKGQATRQNGLKSLESPTLTASEQQTLSEIVARRANDCADIGKAKAEIWSRLHRKFRVAKYNQLPREQLADAIAYVMQMDIKTPPVPAMPAPERTAHAVDATYSYAREQLDSLSDWGRRALPPTVQTEFFAVTKELERALIRGWTEMDEAVMHMAVSMAMLKRWKMAH